MKSIELYIKRGKGLGLLFLLASVVLMVMFMVLPLKSTYTSAKSEVMLVADEFLPITLKDGRIVDPLNAYKSIEIDLGNEGEKKEVFPIVLDTRQESFSVPAESSGVFIMTDMVYINTADHVRLNLQTLPDGVLTTERFAEVLDNIVGYVSFFVTIILVVVYFLLLLLETCLAVLFGRIWLKVMKKSEMLDMGGLMRLSAIMVASLELILFLVGIKIALISWEVYVILLVMMPVVLHKMQSEEDEPDGMLSGK